MSSIVTVIIPHFNRSRLLAEALRSVRRQSSGDWEIVVADDGSDDAEWRVVRGFADGDRIRVIRREGSPKGPSRCRNLALKEARGEFVVFLDSDDLLAPWCLESRLAAFRGEPEADFLVFPVLLFTEVPGDSDLLWNRLEGSDDLERFLRSDPPWCVSAPIWRREALERLGGFNERMLYDDDGELHARAILDGARYRKMADMLPDCFIRRGAAGRITNTLSPDLVESRRVRLGEVHAVLIGRGCAEKVLAVWQGEFFAEAEFLLFNVKEAREPVQRVLQDLFKAYGVRGWRAALVRTYFALALFFRDRWYFALRIVRRLAMPFLPRAYVERPRTYQAVRLPGETVGRLKERLLRP